MGSHLNNYALSLKTLPLEEIERFRETLNHSVGGGVPGPIESAVILDFRAAIEKELAERKAQ